MNRLIRALERSDIPVLNRALGPNAWATLDRLLADKSWERLLEELGYKPARSEDDMGYRFDVPGPWSEPEETLEDKVHDWPSVPLAPEKIAIDTKFTDRAGTECERHTVEFQADQSSRAYQINNSDIGSLLRSIAGCLAQ